MEENGEDCGDVESAGHAGEPTVKLLEGIMRDLRRDIGDIGYGRHRNGYRDVQIGFADRLKALAEIQKRRAEVLPGARRPSSKIKR